MVQNILLSSLGFPCCVFFLVESTDPLNRGLIVTLKCWLTVWREELCHQQGETRLMISAGMRVSRRPFYHQKSLISAPARSTCRRFGHHLHCHMPMVTRTAPLD